MHIRSQSGSVPTEIGTGHVLLAMLKNKDSAAFKLISLRKVDIEKIYTDIIRTCGFNQRFAKQDYKAYAAGKRSGRPATPMLDRYARNMSR